MWRRNHRRGARLQARRRRGQNLPGSTAAHWTCGETFTFEGDDHLWAFINGKLPLDLGGLHATATGSVNLDAQAAALGITPGNNYKLELFHAERGMTESHFRIDTTLKLTQCGEIVVK